MFNAAPSEVGENSIKQLLERTSREQLGLGGEKDLANYMHLLRGALSSLRVRVVRLVLRTVFRRVVGLLWAQVSFCTSMPRYALCTISADAHDSSLVAV